MKNQGARSTLNARRSSTRFLIVLLLTSAITPSCATLNARNFAPKVAKIEISNWRELRSPDFILYSHGPKEDLEKSALDLARFVAMVEHLVHAHPPKTPAQIFLVDDFAEALFIPWRQVGGYMDHSLTGFDGRPVPLFPSKAASQLTDVIEFMPC